MLQCCHWKRWKSDYLAKLRRRDVLIGARSQNEWISNWVFSAENWWWGSRSICRRAACSESQGNYTFVALAPQTSSRFTKIHIIVPMEIKFHIIVKLKGDLSDLFKQVHTRIMLLRSLNSESVPEPNGHWYTIRKRIQSWSKLNGGNNWRDIMSSSNWPIWKVLSINRRKREWEEIVGLAGKVEVDHHFVSFKDGFRRARKLAVWFGDKMRKTAIWGKLSEQQQMSLEVHFLGE